MGRQDQIISERLKKLEEMKKAGINPYPNKYEFDSYSKDIKEKYNSLKNDERTHDIVKIAGRVMTIRDLGKLIFVTIQDQKGRIQLIFQNQATDKESLEIFKKYIDIGDFIGSKGTVMKSRTGEISILVKELEILSKSLLPLPEKFHGLSNEEDRLRKRYLDIMMNEDTKELFLKKAKFWNTIRQFLLERGFIEVETPVLETSAGGASATPFKTHHNALDIDVYLRISMGELWQKKLMTAGLGKTFEIGRQFRNEGMDMEHLQDYTQMEFYWSYANYKDGMKLVEEMYKKVAIEVLGKLDFSTNGHEIDLGKKWEIYDYESMIKKYTEIDIYNADENKIKEKLDELKIEYDNKIDKWALVDILWKYTRKHLSGPGFLIGQPVDIAPLAKRNPDDKRKVEQFQVIIAGSELGNGYSELNDPIDQEERFMKQTELKEKGDIEAQEHDIGFVEALKYGMPPTCGFGVSERLFSYMMNKPIRECVIFPLMKPEILEEKQLKAEKQIEMALDKIIKEENIKTKSKKKVIKKKKINKPVSKKNKKKKVISKKQIKKKIKMKKR
ncbi:MAG: lysine--tRNA ligase [Nanoarchaeota archaeon]|nr:lysine--tRNA ligase [Nanoarchaeota archaeon]